MKLRAALAASCTLALAASGASAFAAAPHKACNLVKDNTGDTFALRSQDTAAKYGPQEDSLDIKTVDIATNAKYVTGVMRVVKLAATPPTSPYGVSYEIEWLVPGSDNPLYLAAERSLDGGDVFVAGFRDATSNLGTALATVKGTFDVAKSEIRITAPVGVFSGQGKGMKPGVKITFGDLDQTASRNGVAVSVFADVVRSGVVYTTGAPSCVTPGK